MYLLTRILGCRHLLFVLLLLAFFILFPVLTVHGAQPADFNDDERDDFSTTAAAKPLSTNTELLTTEISLPDSADPATTTTESSTSGLSAPPPPLSLSPPLSSAETVGSCPTIAGFDLAFINRTTSKLLSLANSAAEEADEVCEVDRLLDQLLPPGYEPAVNFDLGQAIRVEHINQTLATADRLLTLISNYSQTFAPLNTRVLNRFSYLLLGLPLSPKCMSSLLAISGAIRRRELWAMKFLDATGKPPAGVLDGVFSAVGDYRQCLSIQSPSPPFSSRSVKAKESSSSEGRLPSFGGQYCWLAPVLPHPPRNSYRRGDRLGSVGSVNVPTSMVDELVEVLYLVNGSLFQLGLCLPTTCSAGEVELALNTILYPILHIPLKVGPQCSTAEQSQQWGPLDGYQKMAM
ncbi:hypothetical protein TYRP_008672 [Tyrophagus putrescentiae]|nr:hypothetical protein TYRP_008672 [Tyrophagus putrescentiae]